MLPPKENQERFSLGFFLYAQFEWETLCLKISLNQWIHDFLMRGDLEGIILGA